MSSAPSSSGNANSNDHEKGEQKENDFFPLLDVDQMFFLDHDEQNIFGELMHPDLDNTNLPKTGDERDFASPNFSWEVSRLSFSSFSSDVLGDEIMSGNVQLEPPMTKEISVSTPQTVLHDSPLLNSTENNQNLPRVSRRVQGKRKRLESKKVKDDCVGTPPVEEIQRRETRYSIRKRNRSNQMNGVEASCISSAFSCDSTEGTHHSTSLVSSSTKKGTNSATKKTNIIGEENANKFIQQIRLLADSEAAVAADKQIKSLMLSSPASDDESQDAKKQRRLIRNRISAQLHRERKRIYLETLEIEIVKAVKDMEEMRYQIEDLKKKNLKLEMENQKLQKENHRTSLAHSNNNNNSNYRGLSGSLSGGSTNVGTLSVTSSPLCTSLDYPSHVDSQHDGDLLQHLWDDNHHPNSSDNNGTQQRPYSSSDRSTTISHSFLPDKETNTRRTFTGVALMAFVFFFGLFLGDEQLHYRNNYSNSYNYNSLSYTEGSLNDGRALALPRVDSSVHTDEASLIGLQHSNGRILLSIEENLHQRGDGDGHSDASTTTSTSKSSSSSSNNNNNNKSVFQQPVFVANALASASLDRILTLKSSSDNDDLDRSNHLRGGVVKNEAGKEISIRDEIMWKYLNTLQEQTSTALQLYSHYNGNNNGDLDGIHFTSNLICPAVIGHMDPKLSLKLLSDRNSNSDSNNGGANTHASTSNSLPSVIVNSSELGDETTPVDQHSTSEPDEGPFIVIAIPESSIEFGILDSTSSTRTTTSSNDVDDNNNINHNIYNHKPDDDEEEEVWLEIGCKVITSRRINPNQVAGLKNI